MSEPPITFKGQHFINLFIGLSILFLIYFLCRSQSSNIFWTIVAISFLVEFADYSNRGADMPVVISMLNSILVGRSCIGFYRKYSFNYYRVLVGSSGPFFHT